MKRITVAYGDGIGPEITQSVLDIIKASGAELEWDVIEIGEALYKKGIMSGIPDEAWDKIRQNKVFLKAPITTPQGGGYKSLNVTIRKSLNLYANVRQSRSYAPYVVSLHPGMNLTIIRENEEDLYAGIEHQQTDEVVQTLKIISRSGTERIIRYAFEYACAYGRKKITCMTKDNIMKQSDGLFHKTFDEVAKEYPQIQTEHLIIDIGAARLAAQPERFEVIVTLNLYGDILSDIAAQIAGSVGLAGSANIGMDMAMFEAVHGSAPDIAGRNVANPSGLLMAGCQMLVHLGIAECATKIENAWLCTLEDGIHTPDIYREGVSEREVGTNEFTAAIIERLGREPDVLRPVKYNSRKISIPEPIIKGKKKELVGVDVFLDWDDADRDPNVLGKKLEVIYSDELKLKMISNRGVKVYPGGMPETYCADHWRCRFMTNKPISNEKVIYLLNNIHNSGLEIIKTENLYTFDGERGFSVGQGE